MTRAESVEGVLPVDKPVGPTSHDVVAMARRALRTRRVGHAGTLDPFASGLLLLCIGRATRIARFLTDQPKSYDAELRLGTATDTDDHTGTPIRESDDWRSITRAAFEAALPAFTGLLLQLPATYSAKKVGGVRAHEAARAGRTLELTPVPVHIHVLRLTYWAPPLAGITVTCSSGTYVRALARDIGAACGVGAHLTKLRRTAIGDCEVAEAISLEQLAAGVPPGALIPPLAALHGLPRIDLDEAQLGHIRHGRPLQLEHEPGTVVLSAHGELVAIAEAAGGRVLPRKVFVP